MLAVYPQPWTHHHTKRLYHLSVAVCFSFAAIFALLGSMVSWYQVKADETVSLSATVYPINPGPTLVDGTGFIPPVQTPPQPGLSVAKLSLDFPFEQLPDALRAKFSRQSIRDNKQPKYESVTIDGIQQQAQVYTSQYPDFFGKTNIPNAIIHIEIHSEQILRATTYADEAGFWVWHSVDPISQGLHTMTVTAQNTNDPKISATAKKAFVINAATSEPLTNHQSLVEAPGNNAVLFDVFVKIQSKFKQIPAGDDLIATVKLVNFGAAGTPVDVPVLYIIEDANHKVIMEVKETVAVATQISLVKSFFTNQNLPEGTYTLIVRAPTKDAIAMASDTFEIKGSPVIALSESARVDFTIVFQSLLALFSLFCIVTYFEYNKVASLSGIIKRVSVADLKN